MVVMAVSHGECLQNNLNRMSEMMRKITISKPSLQCRYLHEAFQLGRSFEETLNAMAHNERIDAKKEA